MKRLWVLLFLAAFFLVWISVELQSANSKLTPRTTGFAGCLSVGTP